MRETYSNFNLSRYKLKKYVSLTNFRYAPPIKSNFDQFNKYIKTNMSFYNISQSLDTNRTKLSFNKSPIRLEQKEKDFIKQITEEKNNSRNINKNSSQNTINNSKELQINTSISTPKDLNLYMNPLHSLSILRINNKVRSNIIQLNLKRQRYIFDKTGAIPAQSLVIGDDPDADIAGAVEYGLKCVFFNRKGKECGYKVDAEISDLMALTNMLL